jgi:hypothetical protein
MRQKRKEELERLCVAYGVYSGEDSSEGFGNI